MKTPVAELITIGDEILFGQTLDTNSQWLCQVLSDAGISVRYRSTIGDNRADILEAFERSAGRSELVLITGGLGPTSDDLTKPCLAEYLGVELKLHREALDHITRLFKSRGREMTDINRRQAELPEGCTYLRNDHGSAPGMWMEKDDTIMVSMPGVPMEMKHVMQERVMPILGRRWKLPVIYHKIIQTAGIGESWLSERIADWEEGLPEGTRLAYLPTLCQVKLRLTTVAETMEKAEWQTEECVKDLHNYIDKYIYGYNDETLESAVGKILSERNLTLSVAESCTGGHLAHLITSVPGSSTYFSGGIVSYSNRLKEEFLQVDIKTLEECGAVSEEVICEMVEGVRKALGTDVAMATSGIAGPDGGSGDKPVGTVFIATSVKGKIEFRKLQIGDRGRINNIIFSSKAALNLLRLQLRNIRE